jgi:hypothetical protein
VGKDVHYFQGMGDEGLTGKALLMGMLNGREFVRPPEQREILAPTVRLHLPENILKLNDTHN